MTMKADGHSFEVYADADFSGGYQKGHTDDPNTVKSCSAYHILYNGCLIYRISKLQTEVALSTTEAEYVCFCELEKHVDGFKVPSPITKCKAFKDNSG